jgi:DnaJ-class molecular chaperone
MGNGYRTIYKDASWKEKTSIDCAYCHSQGEVEITEETILGEINKMMESSKC